MLAPHVPAARRVADRFLSALGEGRRVRNDDDRLRAHHVYPYLLAWLDHAPRDDVATAPQPGPGRAYLEACGLLVDRTPERFLIAGANKGAPFRIYHGARLVANDSGLAAVLEDRRVLVSHLGHDAEVSDDGDTLTSRQPLSAARNEVMSPLKLVALRLFMVTVGRWCRTFVRKLLQRRLITGAAAAPLTLTRTIERTGSGFRVTDVVERQPGAPRVARLSLGVGQTSSYIAVSQPFDPSWLIPWTDLNSHVAALNDTDRVEIVRQF